MHYLLVYETSADYLDRRADFREEHLRLAWRAVERGELVLGGAVGEPPDSAILLFDSDSPDVAAAFARADPYVLGGLVTTWQVRPWQTVVGKEASSPIRPS